MIDLSQATPGRQAARGDRASDSEDQAMTWSPNGKWIAFHTHREMSDDVWLRPADGKAAGSAASRSSAAVRRLGGRAGRPTARSCCSTALARATAAPCFTRLASTRRVATVTSDLQEVPAEGFDGEITHAEWLPGSASRSCAREGRARATRHHHRCRSGRRAATWCIEFADRARLLRPWQFRPTADMWRLRRPRLTATIRSFEIASAAMRPPMQLTTRSVEQDAAGVVARWRARRLHDLELRRRVLVVHADDRRLPDWLPRSILTFAGGLRPPHLSRRPDRRRHRRPGRAAAGDGVRDRVGPHAAGRHLLRDHHRLRHLGARRIALPDRRSDRRVRRRRRRHHRASTASTACSCAR